MTLKTEKRTLLIIVTEAMIEETLVRDLEKHGVRGYTIVDARGSGTRGVRDGAFDAAANIRIEVMCARTLAESIMAHLQAQYYANYAMVAFMQEIEILRPDKF